MSGATTVPRGSSHDPAVPPGRRALAAPPAVEEPLLDLDGERTRVLAGVGLLGDVPQLVPRRLELRPSLAPGRCYTRFHLVF